MTENVTSIRRGRPRNLARRREIARQALEAFADHGYDGATMASIASRCSMGPTLLARYFPRKEALLEAAVDYACESVNTAAEALRLAAAREPMLHEFLLRAGTIYARHVEENAAWYAAWLGSLPIEAAQRVRVIAAEEGAYRAVAGFVAEKGARGDAYVLARGFLGALQVHVLLQNRAAFESQRLELRRVFLEELVWLFVNGATGDRHGVGHR